MITDQSTILNRTLLTKKLKARCEASVSFKIKKTLQWDVDKIIENK